MVFDELNHSKNTIASLKNKFKDTKLKEKTWQDDKHQLDEVVMITWNNFTDERITLEMFSKAKIFELREVDDNLWKWVADMEIKMNLSTPPKVLEAQRNVVREDA